ncbi:hypothetical protein [Thiomicrospira sp.]|uniref:hypothetical protein n=1 Tax=Thiomicrospira sp. TaxID=935 RepID=UPI002F94614D
MSIKNKNQAWWQPRHQAWWLLFKAYTARIQTTFTYLKAFFRFNLILVSKSILNLETRIGSNAPIKINK